MKTIKIIICLVILSSCSPPISNDTQIMLNNYALKLPYKKGDVVYVKPDSSVVLITGYTGSLFYKNKGEDSLIFLYTVTGAENKKYELEPEFIYGLKHQPKPASEY